MSAKRASLCVSLPVRASIHHSHLTHRRLRGCGSRVDYVGGTLPCEFVDSADMSVSVRLACQGAVRDKSPAQYRLLPCVIALLFCPRFFSDTVCHIIPCCGSRSVPVQSALQRLLRMGKGVVSGSYYLFETGGRVERRTSQEEDATRASTNSELRMGELIWPAPPRLILEGSMPVTEYVKTTAWQNYKVLARY